jgi:PhzF family phenazine biosynthesis protein
MSARIPVFQIDAFTAAPFGGNPAAVVFLDGPADPAWMQRIAQEMNLAETAFLHPEADAYRLRWFTPGTEVELCGHATLATAHALWETGRLPRGDVARFQTLSGLLTARWDDGWIELDFPATPPAEVEPPVGLLDALGLATARWVGRSRFDAFVEVESAAAVRALAPDFVALGRVPVRGVAVTARSDEPGCDVVSRFFAPAVAIDEDPVTGSAHSALTPYWAGKLGRDGFVARQLSARGGVLKVRLAGERVRIAGQAVTVLECQLLASPVPRLP